MVSPPPSLERLLAKGNIITKMCDNTREGLESVIVFVKRLSGGNGFTRNLGDNNAPFCCGVQTVGYVSWVRVGVQAMIWDVTSSAREFCFNCPLG